MKLFSKWWKFHTAMLISLSLSIAGCGGGGSGDGVDAGKGSGSLADNGIPNGSGSGIVDNSNGAGSNGSVIDNSNGNVLPTGTTKQVEFFVDTNNAIDDLSLLDAGGVPTFGKKGKSEKAYRGKAADINKLWAVQYSASGVIEGLYPMAKAGSKYTFSASLSDSRDYKFVFLAYENGRWTTDPREIYAGPSQYTTKFGSNGIVNELNGFTDAAGNASYLRLSDQSAIKASLAQIGTVNGITFTAREGGFKGNSIQVTMQPATRATYYQGVFYINAATSAAPGVATPFVRYRTVSGAQGNVTIQFQYHASFVGKKQVNTEGAATRANYLANAGNDDYDIWEYTSYSASTNTITFHYGPETNLTTVAMILQARNPGKIAFADVAENGTGVIDDGLASGLTAILDPDESKVNSGNGNLVASGNTDGEKTWMQYVPGTSTIEIYYADQAKAVATGDVDYEAKATTGGASRPVTIAPALVEITATLGDLALAYADSNSNIRDVVAFSYGTDAPTTKLVAGNIATFTINQNPLKHLAGGVDAAGNAVIKSFDKGLNPHFVWKDALALFTPEDGTQFADATLNIKANKTIANAANNSLIATVNPTAFANLYKNFSYFGIYHLKGSEIVAKKSKTTVEAKIVSAQSYRQEANIGPAVYKIDNDTFTLGAGTGEVILHIRNYYNSEVSLDDLRITASIRNANLDSDSGKVSVALPVPATGYTIALTAGTANVPKPAALGVVDDDGVQVAHPITVINTLMTFKDVSGATLKKVFPGLTSADNSLLFADADTSVQNFTLNKMSRTDLIRQFQWEDETVLLAGTPVTKKSKKANTDTIIYSVNPNMIQNVTQGGLDVRTSFISRSETNGIYKANSLGEFIDINYHLYYMPRSAIGTDTILVFIEDGTQDPTGNLKGPRDAGLVSSNKVAESHSPNVGLDGTIIPYTGSDADLIYNTLSLEIPVDTIVPNDGDSVLEEPDATTSFSIVFDAAANDGSTLGQGEADPSTMTVAAHLVNERVGETYTYEWNWTKFMDLEGDNAMIGMPDGAAFHGIGKHIVLFTDATGKHPNYGSVKVTLRASPGLDPEGTRRPFDPSTFNPNAKTLIENVDRDFVFLANYDANTDALNMTTAGLKAAVKLDLTTDTTVAHLIVTPKTNSAGEILASGSEIAAAVRYYLQNSTIIASLKASDSKFDLVSVEGRGTTLDDIPYFAVIRGDEAGGKVMSGARVADDNAGPSLDLHFKNSDDYLNVRDAGAPILSVMIKDTVPNHDGSKFIVFLNNAYPPVLSAPSGTFNNIVYSFVSYPTDGLTADNAKKAKVNNEIFLSVQDDTDADGAVTLINRVKRVNAGTNDTEVMQEASKKINGVEIGNRSDRGNQFVAYWDIRRVSNQSVQSLKGPGHDPLNNWVLAEAVDFVGSGADSNTGATVYGKVFDAVYQASLADGDTEAEAKAIAAYAAKVAHNGGTVANVQAAATQYITAYGHTGGTGNRNASVASGMADARAILVNSIKQAAYAKKAEITTAATTGQIDTAIAVALSATTGLMGRTADLYAAVFAVAGGDSAYKRHQLAVAAVKAYERNLADELYKQEAQTVYTAIYNEAYAVIRGAKNAGGDYISDENAKKVATVSAEAAISGAATFSALLFSYESVSNLNLTLVGTHTLNNKIHAKLKAIATINLDKYLTALTAKANATLPALSVLYVPKFQIAGANDIFALAGTAAVGFGSNIYNNAIAGLVAPNSWLAVEKVAQAASDAIGKMNEDMINLIPADARKFNLVNKGDAGQHDATLTNDPDDPTNTSLQHMLFRCRVILPTSAAARDSYMLNFRFRPGAPSTVVAPPIMTNSYIVTVTK